MTTPRDWKSATEIVTRIETDYGIHYESDTVRVWRGRGEGFDPEWAVQVGRQWLYDEEAVIGWVEDTGRDKAKRVGR